MITPRQHQLSATAEKTLAGRDAELAELRDAAIRAAADGRGWVGLIGGEPGIGKTRLAARCADRLARDGFGTTWVSFRKMTPRPRSGSGTSCWVSLVPAPRRSDLPGLTWAKSRPESGL